MAEQKRVYISNNYFIIDGEDTALRRYPLKSIYFTQDGQLFNFFFGITLTQASPVEKQLDFDDIVDQTDTPYPTLGDFVDFVEDNTGGVPPPPPPPADNSPYTYVEPVATILARDPSINTGVLALSTDTLLVLSSDGVDWFTTKIRGNSSGFVMFIGGDPTMSSTTLAMPQVFATERLVIGASFKFIGRNIPAEDILNTDSRITAFSGDIPNPGDNKKIYLNYDFTSAAYTITDDKLNFDVNTIFHVLDFFIENVGGTTEYSIVPDPNIAIYPFIAVHSSNERRTLYNAMISELNPSFSSPAASEIQIDIPTYQVIVEGINYPDINNTNVATVERDGTVGKLLEIIWRTNPLVGILAGQGDGSLSVLANEYWDTTLNVIATTPNPLGSKFITILIYIDYYRNQFGGSNGIVYAIPYQTPTGTFPYTSVNEALADLDTYRNNLMLPDALRGTTPSLALITRADVSSGGGSDITDPTVFAARDLTGIAPSGGASTTVPLKGLDEPADPDAALVHPDGLRLQDIPNVALADDGNVELDFTEPTTQSDLLTITQITTLAFLNAKRGYAYELNITGDFALTFPTEFSQLGSQVYVGTLENSIFIICKDDTAAAEKFDYRIITRN